MNNYLTKRARAPIANIGIGLAGGTGIGLLIDLLLNNKKREAENYRWWKRPLTYAALGSIPGLLQAISHYQNSFTDASRYENIKSRFDSHLGKLDPLLLTSDQLKEKSPVYANNILKLLTENSVRTEYNNPRNKPEKSLDRKMTKASSLYKRALGWTDPNIPVNAVNNSIFNTPGMNQNAMRNIPNTLNATQTATGLPYVSPAQVAGTLFNAGVGNVTGMVIGKTIGALCGLSPQSYNTIKNMGMYAGMMNTMGNAINRY